MSQLHARWGALLAFSLLAPAPALAQRVWTRAPVSGPSARAQHKMAYDTARAVIVLYGGTGTAGGVGADETWEWNGATWTQRVVSAPPARSRPAMAYDSTRAVTIVYGGQDAHPPGPGYFPFDDTWEWNGSVWTQRLVSGPPARLSYTMAYDAARGVGVIFGGNDANAGFYGDTWEYNGSVWTQRVVSGPSARSNFAMVYDTARARTVLFGGLTSAGQNGETWEWDGTAWTQRPVSGPAARQVSALAYDSARGVTVLFGGYTGSYNGETWEWNGTAWTQLAITGPSPRAGAAMAYDAARDAIVLFGGSYPGPVSYDDTWLLTPPCSTPTITVQPSPRIACPGGSAGFNLAAAGGLLSYEWQVQTGAPTASGWQTLGTEPSSLACGAVAYATPNNSPSPIIAIRPCPGTTPGAAQYFRVRCLVTAPCGGVTSNQATYAVCSADFDCSGSVALQDIFGFLGAWFAQSPAADINARDGTTVQDIFDFLAAWFSGC